VPDFSSIWFNEKQRFKQDKHVVTRFGKQHVWTVRGEWLNGVPHGVCMYEGENDSGVATFTKGELHGGPHWYQRKSNGIRESFECMHHGDSAGVVKWYCNDKSFSTVDRLDKKTATPGWMYEIRKDDSH
jgi:hypothetical protein